MSRTYSRGETSETKVGLVLQELYEDKEVLLCEGIQILRIKHAKPNSDLDLKFADYLVLVQHGDDRVPVPIQVKSSERVRREFEEEMDRKNLPHIMSVAVHARDRLQKIKEQVIQCLKNAIRLFRNGCDHLFQSFWPHLHGSSGDIITRREYRRPTSKEMRLERKRERLGYYYVHPARMAH